MKIGILTQALRVNYGCLMQNYALQQTLKKMGHEPITVDFSFRYKYDNYFRQLLGWVNRMRLYYLNNVNISPCFELRPNENLQFYIAKHTREWVRKNINTTRDILYFEELEDIDRENDFDAYVVGSDQVFIPYYASWFMGKFIHRKGVKMYAYAASFGKGEWLLDSKETEETKLLASNFIAISVRERSAVDLCRNYWGIDAKHVLDPALLLDAEDYLKTITLKRESNILFAYVLDESSLKRDIVEAMANSRKLKIYRCMPKEELINGVTKNLDNCIYPPVDNWLNGFNNATCVVTDSFHGVVFSIIFRKPFVVIGNTQRGMARFESLLTMLGLENRMVKDVDSAIEMMDIIIDYESVYAILKCKRCEALNFLSQISE